MFAVNQQTLKEIDGSGATHQNVILNFERTRSRFIATNGKVLQPRKAGETSQEPVR